MSAYFWVPEAYYEANVMDGALRIDLKLKELVAFWFVWYFFFCCTYGTNLPAGLFSPGIVMGFAIGQMYYLIQTSPDYMNMENIDPCMERKYMVIGCAAIISGYVRLRYSVVIIMLEIS